MYPKAKKKFFFSTEPVAEVKRSDESAQKEEVKFTTVLASVELKSIGIKLYRKGHALVSNWVPSGNLILSLIFCRSTSINIY